jgi:hypothetical protein
MSNDTNIESLQNDFNSTMRDFQRASEKLIVAIIGTAPAPDVRQAALAAADALHAGGAALFQVAEALRLRELAMQTKDAELN